MRTSISIRVATISIGLIVIIWFIYPYAWMCLSAFKHNREIYNPLQFFPSQFNFSYFADVFSGKYIDFKSAFFSSVWIAVIQAIGAVLISASTGYAIARYKFHFKKLLFLLAITLIILPKQAMSIPIFEWINHLNIHGSYSSIILPGLASGIGILFFLQIFRKIPQEYIDISRVEGASEFRTFITVLPMVIPALLTYGVIHFILAWNDHLVPLLLLEDSKRTLPLALSSLNDSSQRVPQAVVLAASIFTVLPVAILFGFLYRQFKSSMSEVLVH